MILMGMILQSHLYYVQRAKALLAHLAPDRTVPSQLTRNLQIFTRRRKEFHITSNIMLRKVGLAQLKKLGWLISKTHEVMIIEGPF